MSRLAAALQTQNRALRANILREFETLDALRARTPKFAHRNEQFQQSLLAGCAQNERALTQIFGAEATPSLLERVLPLDWLPSSSHHPYGGRWDSVSAIYDGLGSVWRHAVKDWSGHKGHELLHGRIVDALAADGAESVLVAGCGQGRLATRIATALPRARVVGVEQSEAQLGVARFMLDATAERSVTFHPFLDEARNNATAETRLHAVEAPDIALSGGPPNLSLRLGSFDADAAASAGLGGADAVVASFFLDCLEDTVAAVEALRACVRPGGLVVFAGPLAYHHLPTLAPTLDGLAALSGELGLPLVGDLDVVDAPYPERPGALREESAWRAGFFVARRAE